MKAILVDDESLALEVLEQKLGKYRDIEIVGSYTDPLEALEVIKEKELDLVFLDIEMGAINGLEIAQDYINHREDLEIIFITAYSKYAVDAFTVNALDYLLKPVEEDRLGKTIERLKFRIGKKKKKEEVLNGENIRISSFGKFDIWDKEGKAVYWRTQKAKELFAYLWLADGRPVSKNIILDTIFPDKNLEKASTILHTTVYQIRKNLLELGFTNTILYRNDSYLLNLPYISDKEELDEILDKELVGEETAKDLLRIYKGDLMAEEAYIWAHNKQEKYRRLVFDKLEKYVQAKLEKKEVESDLKPYIDFLLKIEPYRESAAQDMINYYGLNRMQADLKVFYENYKKNLGKDMGLEPMEETERIYRKFMK